MHWKEKRSAIELKGATFRMDEMRTTSSKRSDLLREKRKTSSRNKLLLTTRRKRRMSSPITPPVIARNLSAGIPLSENKPARKTRRRFDLALSSPGAEMRLPALPQVRVGWRLLTFVLLAAFSFALYSLWNAPIFRVATAQVVGLRRVTNEAVNTVVEVSGQSIFTLDAEHIQQVIQDGFQEFSAAQVEVSLPNSVVITVTERVPVLIWVQDERTNLVDENGVTFPARIENENLNLPVVESDSNPPLPAGVSADFAAGPGFNQPASPSLGESAYIEGMSSRPLLTREMVAAILLMAKYAPADAQLVYTSDHGLVWQDKRGWSVYFGSPDNMEMKLKVYRAILDHLKAEDARPEMISVEFLDAPYYRLAG